MTLITVLFSPLQEKSIASENSIMNLITFLLVAVISIILNCCCVSAKKGLNAESLSKLAPTCVYFKNAHFDEYLISSFHESEEFETKMVFTANYGGSPADWKEDNRRSAIWLLERAICQGCYTLKSLIYPNFQQTMFAVSSNNPRFQTSRPRRLVYVFAGNSAFPEEQGQNIWKIQSEPSSSLNHVRIQTKIIGQETGEFLYAVGNSEKKGRTNRHVFTWSSKADSDAFGSQGKWIIESVNCPKDVVL